MQRETTRPRPARVPQDGLPAFARAVNRHFHESEEPEDVDPYLRAFATGYRAWWVRQGERIVANLGVIETDISLPGGARLPVAAVTAVGVSQVMRRRGLLSALMAASLDEAMDREEPLAALFASESAIYGRYGFGIAAPHRAYRAERAKVRFLDPVDVRLVEETTPEAALATWPALHERVRDTRGGSVGNTPGQWQLGLVDDPPSWRDGATARRLVEVPGRGYARYRVKSQEESHYPEGLVLLSELVATDPEANAALWQHVLDIDLTTRVISWIRPPDDAVAHLLDDPLALHAFDGPPLYVRILDVPRLLTGRAYGVAGTAVLDVVDPSGRAGGRWRLETDATSATCTPSSDTPDVTLPIDALAGVVFGGVPVTALLDGRRLREEHDGAAAALDRLVAADRAPWSTFMF
jgi:predicted acetyltransferase